MVGNFPVEPIAGQEYIDVYGIKWIFDIGQRQWVEIGPEVKIPIAKSGDECLEA